MSVVFQDNIGWVLSHDMFVKSIYGEVYDNNVTYRLEFDPALFKIETPFINKAPIDSDNSLASDNSGNLWFSPKKKRRTNRNGAESTNNSAQQVVNLVANKSSALLNNAKKQGVFNCEPSSSDNLRRNEDARNLSVTFYKENSDEQNKTFHGANNQEFPIIVSHGEKKYVFPPRCMFFNNDISNLNQKLDVLGKFDLLLLDPPWWNKYIRRKKQKSRESSYSMMYDEDLLKLPVASLIAPGALVAVWCTNSETHINTMKNKIFPSWGIECVSKWYWLKVTRSGIPVCNFSEPPNKQPFEQILFAHQLCTPRSFPLPEDGKIVISVPSAIHSHKPPLTEILSAYLPNNAKCLELFARYLLPGWTSWGNEVLKLQTLSLYQSHEISRTGDET
ncbi:N(6)-adenine-specific methyltransferase METTL4 [Schistocerca cancellata]|uniref:N(6)-adenine-specific methyltransferase METTL4 n=1 Tax=Schistocerca cancellata TaxID=274614 RepID=UPI002117796F|nr:N(6)-adenine-specific methyltransferase METTL4 [Schistocerca cancellata]